MVVDTAKLKGSTKGLFGIALTIGTLLQLPAVHDSLIAMAHAHPHVLSIIATCTFLAALLRNPEVQHALGVEETVTVEKKTVSLATDGGEVQP